MATTADDGEHATDIRLTILETRFDTVLPTLATKADVADLRARFESVLPTLATKNDLAALQTLATKHDLELRTLATKHDLAQLRGEMVTWIAATMITLFLGFGGMVYTMLAYLRPA